MCGRYYIDPEAVKDAESLCNHRNHRIPDRRAGDIHPTEEAPVLVAENDGQIELKLQRWGFPGFKGTGVIFNARAESVLEKKLFAEPVLHARAAIPAAAFYEWDIRKQKWTFRKEDTETLYLGGFWNQEPAGERFVILTTAPNESMTPVHDRMPLILEKDEVRDWLCTDAFRELLTKKGPELHRETKYEQMSLFGGEWYIV